MQQIKKMRGTQKAEDAHPAIATTGARIAIAGNSYPSG
jgi:hypothetical protein